MRTTARRKIVIETPPLGIEALFNDICVPASSLGQAIVAKIVAIVSRGRWRAAGPLVAGRLPCGT